MRYEAMLFDYSFDIGIRFFYTSVGIVLCCTSHTNKWSVHWLAFIRWYTNMVSNRIAQLHSLLRFVQSFFLFISIRSFFHSSFFSCFILCSCPFWSCVNGPKNWLIEMSQIEMGIKMRSKYRKCVQLCVLHIDNQRTESFSVFSFVVFCFLVEMLNCGLFHKTHRCQLRTALIFIIVDCDLSRRSDSHSLIWEWMWLFGAFNATKMHI